MRGLTLLATVSPGKSKLMIRKLVKVKEILEDNLNVRLDLIITESNDGKNLIFLDDEVIELDEGVGVVKIVDTIVEKLGIRQFSLPPDNVAVGASLSSG
jgi:hypothetical protein